MMNIIQSKFQTKEWRQKQPWYKGGRSNECEIYQRELIEKITTMKLPKCNYRLNSRTGELKELTNPMKYKDGYDWTEDFDGLLKLDNDIVLFNLKMVCDAGGAQTRTLREVYHFIQTQIKYYSLNPNSNIWFINILDGNTSSNNMEKFQHLMQVPENLPHVGKIFIGDMFLFRHWFTTNFENVSKASSQ